MLSWNGCRTAHWVFAAAVAIAVASPERAGAQTAPAAVHQDLQQHFETQVEPGLAGLTQFSFAVTGDIHLSPRDVRVLTRTGWQNLLARWRDAGHEFGVIVGDLGFGEPEGIADVVDGYAAVPGAPPIFYTMGNHELDPTMGKRRWIDALYPGAVAAGSWTPTSQLAGNSDRAYWAFDVGPHWRFIILDGDHRTPQGAGSMGTLGRAQLDWLAADLHDHPTRNVMVFLHEPIDQPKYDTPEFTLNDRGLLMDVLAAHPKQKFIFQGHLHSYRGITKWRGITSVHTSEPAADGVSVQINGETATVSWSGMTAADTVDYDQHQMYQVMSDGVTNTLRIGEEGGDYGRTRSRKMTSVGPENGVTPTHGSLMLKAAGPITWHSTWFISEQLVKIVPGMRLSYDIWLDNVRSGKDAVAVQPSWVTHDGSRPPLVTDQNGLALSVHTRDGRHANYFSDLPRLGGLASGAWYRREIDLTPLAGGYADGILLASEAQNVDVGAVYVDNITLTWPAGSGSDPSDTVPPFIADIGSSIANGAVTITWTTDEPASSQVDYGTTTAYGASAYSAALTRAHSVTLRGLAAQTSYHFRVRSRDAAGNLTISPDSTFTTPLNIAAQLVSDDFSADTIDPVVWTFVNPAGVANATVIDNRLQIAVPAGVNHDIWSGGNRAARLMQAASNTDFEVEVRFDSAVTQAYQLQGVLVEQDAANLIRFDYVSDGNGVSAFAASFSGGAPTTRANVRVTTGLPLHMRVRRVGNQWSQFHSSDGQHWQLVASFAHPITVTGVGVFAGNAGAAPAHTAILDYFFNTATPVEPEDNGLHTLLTYVSGSGQVTASPLKSTYEVGEQIQLTATPAPGWSFAGWSGSVSGSSPTAVALVTGDVNVTARFARDALIDLWYGTTQTFGHLGVPQRAINILGTLHLTDGPSLSFRLNGGPPRPLSLGPDGSRLERAGDFNVEIPFSDLTPGLNEVILSATNALGQLLTETVTVDYRAGNVWALPYGVDWETATAVEDVVQVVDGKWQIQDDVVRTMDPGYDRLLNLGDLTWGSYEVTVPITIHSFNYLAHNPPLLGLFAAWRGHHDADGSQPFDGWWQAGGLGYYRWYSADNSTAALELLSPVPGGGNVTDPSFRLQTNGTYVFKLRTELNGSGVRTYAIKVWPQGTVEPLGWNLVTSGPEVAPGGSVLLIAHYVDASFGAVSVVPVQPSDPPPVLSNVTITNLTASSARVTWTTNEPATSAVSYGRTSAYEIGTLTNGTLKTSHSIDLTGLTPATTYHYRAQSAGETGSVGVSPPLTFGTPQGVSEPSTIVSDDFSTGTLSSVWTFVNPRQDAAVRLTGVQAVIDVPGGVTHDVWAGANNAPRLMQPANDTNFTIETKFESPVTRQYQLQGLLVEQDAQNFIRFDIYSDGTNTGLFAATFSGGTATTRLNTFVAQAAAAYMRIDRSGGQWTLSYSTDGAAWQTAAIFSHPMIVSAVGVYGGNAGAAPAHSTVIDYFFNAAAPITPDDGGRFGLFVQITGGGSVSRSPEAPNYPAGQVVGLTAVPAAGWTFGGWSGDASGSNPSTSLAISRDHVVGATFTPLPDTTPPSISNIQVSNVTTTSATITWTTNEPAASSVTYGYTTAYENGTSQDPTLRTSHSIVLAGLMAGTTYHYRVGGTDAAGNTSQSTDRVFTAAGQLSTIASDDFSTTSLNTTRWTFVNPRNDAVLRMTGVHAVIDIPAGVTHDVWTGGNFAPRLMQPANDTDFVITAKFESTVTRQYQAQGLIVEQDAGNFIRYDIFHDGSRTLLFAATFSGGQPTVRLSAPVAIGAPGYLRLGRVGNQWTLSHSLNGSTWQTATSFSHAFTVSAVGVFGGNAGPAPAHTAVVDYFFNGAAPITPEDGGRYGLRIDVSGSGDVLRNPALANYAPGQTVELTAVPAAGWLFAGWGGDASGSASQTTVVLSTDRVVTASFTPMPDTTPPVLSNVQVTQITSSSATVTWTTNEPATSVVSYGPTLAYGGTVSEQTLRTSHSVRLDGLAASTTYHFRVSSADGPGNSSQSADQAFTTVDGPSAATSDDFQGATLNGSIWTFVNPRQDAAVRMTGTQAEIDVPGGVTHDVWTGGNQAPRLMQSVGDTDFTIQAKFDSVVHAQYQLQGLLVEQDADNYIRFDVHSNGSGTALFGATFAGGSPSIRLSTAVGGNGPILLRVARQGNLWTLSFSLDGNVWQTAAQFAQALTVTSVGVFAGNAGPAPAHTALIDHFFNVAAPIVPED